MQSARHAAIVRDGHAVYVDGGTIGGEHGIRSLRAAGDGAIRDIDDRRCCTAGAVVACAACRACIDGAVVAVEAAVVATAATARLAEGAAREGEGSVRHLNDIVILCRTAEALAGLGHCRAVAQNISCTAGVGRGIVLRRLCHCEHCYQAAYCCKERFFYHNDL